MQNLDDDATVAGRHKTSYKSSSSIRLAGCSAACLTPIFSAVASISFFSVTVHWFFAFI
jgi:hypothetical protein